MCLIYDEEKLKRSYEWRLADPDMRKRAFKYREEMRRRGIEVK